MPHDKTNNKMNERNEQCIYRGRQARRHALKKKEEHDTQIERLEAQQEELAALKLQVSFLLLK